MPLRIKDLFDRVEEELANDWSQELKITWLNEIELQVIDEVFLTHKMSETMKERIRAFAGYTVNTPDSTELLVQDPYSALYAYYLEAQIARANGDKAQQQDATTLFDNMYLNYKRYINRTCMPVSKASTFLI